MNSNRSRPKLSVNLNKVALLRNARPLDIPNVVAIGRQCIDAGAHGLTVHPRPDERHIRRHDVDDVAQLLADYPHIEYNIEGNPFTGLMEIVRLVKPTQCTLVPDDPRQSTSDHGWDIGRDGERLGPIIRELRELGIRVSLFMDPDVGQIERVAELEAERIELYTEPYAAAFAQGNADSVLQQYAQAAGRARQLGLEVNAGHDLNLDNLPLLLTIPGILECSIGHALTADALTYGFRETVGKYLAVMAGEQREAA
jgi:pyridoxine 5-phosphate synthase